MEQILGQALQQVVFQFFSAIPRIFTAIVILLAGVFISRLLIKMIQTILSRTGIDKLGEQLNNIDFLSKSNLKIVPSTIFSKVIYYLTLLIFITMATDALGMASISQLVVDILNYIPQLLIASIVLAIGVFFADLIKSAVLTTCQSMGIPSGKIIANFVFYFIFINAVVTALGQAKIDTDFIKSNLTVLLGAVASAFALGYGIASKDLMASFLASFYSKERYEVGDKISVDGITGTIIEMDNMAIVLQTEGKKIIVPMSKLTNEKVEIHE
jgi:hypothetical protein